MKTVLTLPLALLCVSFGSLAATVEYRDPNLTVVAQDEPLQSVLKSLRREMRIYVAVPTGLNPVINCDIHSQPVKQAFKTLLGKYSYSLEWDDESGQLVGVTLLAGTGESVAASSSSRSPANDGVQALPANPALQAAAAPVHTGDVAAPEVDERMAADRTEMEARMAEERAVREAEMAQRRQEEEVAHQERMRLEVQRHDAENAAALEAEGIHLPQ